MAESLVVFDPVVFDKAIFDSLEITPVVGKIEVPEPMQVAAFGQIVSIFAYIYNVESTPNHAFPVSTPTPPQIEVYDPLDTISVAFTDMTWIDEGICMYQYQIPSVGFTGAYACRVKTLNGSKSSITEKVVATVVLGP